MRTRFKDTVAMLLSIFVGVSTFSATAGELESLDPYRLWRVRDVAMKKQDARAIEKSVEVANSVRTRKDSTPQQIVELRDLNVELERRESLAPVVAVPSELKERDYPFGVPRREQLQVRFAKTKAERGQGRQKGVRTHLTKSPDPFCFPAPALQRRLTRPNGVGDLFW